MNWRAVYALALAAIIGGIVGYTIDHRASPPHVCPLPLDLVRDFNPGGPIEVEFSHGEQRIRFSLGSAAGFPIVASPRTGQRFVMLEVKR